MELSLTALFLFWCLTLMTGDLEAEKEKKQTQKQAPVIHVNGSEPNKSARSKQRKIPGKNPGKVVHKRNITKNRSAGRLG